jgi:hypothetical protein
MASWKTRISRVPPAPAFALRASARSRRSLGAGGTLIAWTVCTAALLAQTAQTPAFPNAPQGFDEPRQGIATGRVERVEYTS